MTDEQEIEIGNESDKEIRKAIHISVGTAGAEILISSNDPDDGLDDIIKQAEKLVDKYYHNR